jgi:hypothetical protein
MKNGRVMKSEPAQYIEDFLDDLRKRGDICDWKFEQHPDGTVTAVKLIPSVIEIRTSEP